MTRFDPAYISSPSTSSPVPVPVPVPLVLYEHLFSISRVEIGLGELVGGGRSTSFGVFAMPKGKNYTDLKSLVIPLKGSNWKYGRCSSKDLPLQRCSAIRRELC